MNWIKPSERLPHIRQKVVFYCYGWDIPAIGMFSEDMYAAPGRGMVREPHFYGLNMFGKPDNWAPSLIDWWAPITEVPGPDEHLAAQGWVFTKDVTPPLNAKVLIRHSPDYMREEVYVFRHVGPRELPVFTSDTYDECLDLDEVQQWRLADVPVYPTPYTITFAFEDPRHLELFAKDMCDGDGEFLEQALSRHCDEEEMPSLLFEWKDEQKRFLGYPGATVLVRSIPHEPDPSIPKWTCDITGEELPTLNCLVEALFINDQYSVRLQIKRDDARLFKGVESHFRAIDLIEQARRKVDTTMQIEKWGGYYLTSINGLYDIVAKAVAYAYEMQQFGDVQ